MGYPARTAPMARPASMARRGCRGRRATTAETALPARTERGDRRACPEETASPAPRHRTASQAATVRKDPKVRMVLPAGLAWQGSMACPAPPATTACPGNPAREVRTRARAPAALRQRSLRASCVLLRLAHGDSYRILRSASLPFGWLSQQSVCTVCCVRQGTREPPGTAARRARPESRANAARPVSTGSLVRRETWACKARTVMPAKTARQECRARSGRSALPASLECQAMKGR
jgi:hypothetical protein